MKTYGYVRVSSRDQNEDRQVLAMQDFGVDAVLVEKQSGKNFERPIYKALLDGLAPGDTVVVKSIDRLGRNYEEILEQWRSITKEKQAAIVVLDMPLLDTRQGRDLTGTLIADIVLQLLSYVAEMERTYIRQRQSEGIEAARLRGVRFGAPSKKTEAFYECLRQWQAGAISATGAGAQLGVHRSTFARWAKETISLEEN